METGIAVSTSRVRYVLLKVGVIGLGRLRGIGKLVSPVAGSYWRCGRTRLRGRNREILVWGLLGENLGALSFLTVGPFGFLRPIHRSNMFKGHFEAATAGFKVQLTPLLPIPFI